MAIISRGFAHLGFGGERVIVQYGSSGVRPDGAELIDFLPFDADNHYYEALDAFTRHLDPALGPQVFQWAQIGRMPSRVCTRASSVRS